MRRALIALSALGGTLALAGAAQADDFGDFQALCVANQADPKAVLAAADAGGWMPVPEQMMASLRSKDSPLPNAEGRLRTGPKGMQLLLAAVGAGAFPGSNLKLSICAMGFAPASAELAGQMTAWAAVAEEPALSHAETHAYVFSNGPEGHKRLDLNGQQPAALAAAHAAVAFVQAGPQITMVGYGLPTP